MPRERFNDSERRLRWGAGTEKNVMRGMIHNRAPGMHAQSGRCQASGHKSARSGSAGRFSCPRLSWSGEDPSADSSTVVTQQRRGLYKRLAAPGTDSVMPGARLNGLCKIPGSLDTFLGGCDSPGIGTVQAAGDLVCKLSDFTGLG